MATSAPLVRVRKQNGQVQEVAIGECAVTMVLGVITIAIAALLLLKGAIQLSDLATFLRAVIHR